jgi:peptidoglycan hydrolase-like amidase
MEMARRGSLFREILAHYFPATEIIGLDAPR